MIYTKDKNPYSGLLEMFSKDYLYLLSNNHNDYRYKLPVSKVNRIFILTESNVEVSTGLGALLGLAIGAVIGFITTNENEILGKEGAAAAYGSIGGLVGAIIGLIVGLSGSESDQEIKIEKHIGLIKLKNFAYYNFTYNESREKSYVTIQ